MLRQILMAAVPIAIAVSARATAPKCILAYQTNVEINLSDLPVRLRKTVEQLLKVEADQMRVEIEDRGVAGKTEGIISDIRLHENRLIYKLNGKEYRPFAGIRIKVLGPHLDLRDRASLLQYAAEHPVGARGIEQLFEAQEQGRRVLLNGAGAGLDENLVGHVSALRIENGIVKCRIDGIDCTPFYGFEVSILE